MSLATQTLQAAAARSGKLILPSRTLSALPLADIAEGDDRCQVLQEALPALQSRFSQLSAENDGVFPLLSKANREKLHARWDPHNHSKKASVLVSLYSDNGTPSVIFTARSASMPLNPSEISFPGGHQHGDSESLEETALREAQEELLGDYDWNNPDDLVILGRGTTIPCVTGMPVTPIVSVMTKEIKDPLEKVFPGDKNEVAAVFGMSLDELLEKEESHQLPSHQLLGKDRMGPRYPSPHGHVWGLTAFMLRPLLHQLYRPVLQQQQTLKTENTEEE